MMEKGQMFSLDLLLSLVLVFLAVGLLFRGMEFAAYSGADERGFADIKRVAETTGNMVVGFPGINCLLENTNIRLVNCVDGVSLGTLTLATAREELAIPDEYDFSISEPINGFSIGGDPGEKDFFEVKRSVIVHAGPVSKTEFNSTFRTSIPVEVSIRVWRA